MKVAQIEEGIKLDWKYWFSLLTITQGRSQKLVFFLWLHELIPSS